MNDLRVRAGAIAIYAEIAAPVNSAKPPFEELPDITKHYFDDLAKKVLEAADEWVDETQVTDRTR